MRSRAAALLFALAACATTDAEPRFTDFDPIPRGGSRLSLEDPLWQP